MTPHNDDLLRTHAERLAVLETRIIDMQEHSASELKELRQAIKNLEINLATCPQAARNNGYLHIKMRWTHLAGAGGILSGLGALLWFIVERLASSPIQPPVYPPP